ncbi:MAG: ATP-binding protein [Anaerovoracaceae bacterium]
MTKKIFTGIIVVSLIIMLCCTGLIMGVMYDYLGTQIDKELENEANLVATGMEQSGTAYLQRIEKIGRLKSRVTLVDATGSVLYDSQADEQTMENHLDREEIQMALISGEGHAVRESVTMASETRYYAMKLADGSVLRVSTSHYSQLGLILDTFGMVVVIAAILIALAAIISHNITKHIVKPINDIDLNDPDIPENYEEMAPLLHRIRQQNLKIHRQMEKLRSRQEEFNIITQNMREGLLIIDSNLEVLTWNRSALRILGAPAENEQIKAPKAPSGSVLSLNRSEPFRRAVEESLAGESSKQQMVIGGETYEILASPAFSDGKVTGAILILMNVTERELGEQLRREFTSNVSHELKTPLTSIYGVSDMLASGLVKPEDVNQFAGTIKEESSRLISLIDDIMQLSRLDENYIKKEREDVDLYLVARDVLDRLRSRARQADVTLELLGGSTMIHGVDYILDEIVYNLCENGVKYNRPGGKVTVTVDTERGACVLRVADTGIGIPKEDLDRVFERFYRVDKSHNRQVPGTGLGLSIVKHGVAYHGGTISLESNEGVGTTVTVRFEKQSEA